ncbi:T9SS type A sorting domain-containing protein [Ferruginibacter sp. SUN002]|uniref:T9SS type A sorting domain-containing protein n=1 Tax=Ferruginibacter sp. SUN002 TaxID=2937789 RepID=UPI003D35DC5A
MNRSYTKTFALSCLLLLFCVVGFAQLQLEFDGNSYPSAPSGPSVAPVSANFRLNTTGTTFTNYTLAGQPLTVTASWSNQQYTAVAGGGTQTGNAFGLNSNNSSKLANTSEPVWYTLNTISSPTNAMMTSNPYGTGGTGIDVATNYGFNCFTTTEPLYAANVSTSGRYYYSDLTLTFSKPISNPVFHVIGLGGTVSGLGFATEFDLVTSGITLARISGSNVFKVTSNQILNNSGTINATSSSAGALLADGAGSGAASGSIRMTGNNITSVKFKVYLRGDGSGTKWGASNSYSGDKWLLGFSMNQPVITGNVYDDANALKASPLNTIDGTGTNAGGTLYINLINALGNVVQSVPVQSDGTYTFQDLLPTSYPVTYTARLSTTQGTVGSAAPANSLPSGWINTGELIGTGAGTDGIVDGTSAPIILTGGATYYDNVNFGIEKLPVANDVTAASQTNPGGTIKVIVPTLNGTDLEQGTFSGTGNLDTVIINTIPSVLTMGRLYYNNVLVVAGDTIKNYDPTKLTFDPINGAVTATFTYSEVDAALRASTPATVTMPFATISISGTVNDDANGLKGTPSNTVDGTGTNAGGLNAVLYDAVQDTVVAKIVLPSSGVYSFTGINAGTYSVKITTNNATMGAASPAVALPPNWIHTGEYLGAGAGNDGTVNGILSIGTISINTTNANFGIEQLPTANAVTASSQTNPGSTIKVTVPTLNGADPEQGTFAGTGNLDTVIINTLPNTTTMGRLYYNNVLVAVGDTIKNYDPAKLTLDPADGAITATFTYSEVDAALRSSSTATVTMAFTTISISGNIYDDANGLKGTPYNTVDGIGTNAGGLNAVLYDAVQDTVVAKIVLPSSGAYSFTGLNAGTYSIKVTTNNATIGVASPAVILPSSWVNTGEYLGAGAGNDGTANGILSIGTVVVNVTGANFGIEQLPTANVVTMASQINPGGTIKITVPALNGSDPEQGTFDGLSNLDTVIIKTLPTNGTLYYNNAPVVAGDTIKNYNPSLLKVDPNDGAVTISFTYVEIDAALQSSSSASVSMPFGTTSISGMVYNDANALQDAIVNGTGTNAGNTLYAQLLNSSNTVIATTAVATDGTYSFAGLNGGTYTVLINTVSSASTSTTLPTNWINTGEFNGTGVGNDGTVNGTSAIVTVSTASITDVNFGVEQLPGANAITAANQVNPGGSIKVTVPTLNGSDPEHGSFTGISNLDTVIIKTLPANGTLYYNNVAVAAGDTIKNYNPTLLTVDPNNGAVTLSFTYVEVDAALQSSNTALVSMTFTTLTLSGTLFDDANGLTDDTVNGVGANGSDIDTDLAGSQSLYAQLLDNSNNVIATTAIASNGTYSFTGLDAGVYAIVINQSASANVTPGLPSDWINTGEYGGTGPGNDGNTNGALLSIILSTANVNNINFGLNKIPVADDVTTANQTNPGGTVKVTVPTLTGDDYEDNVYNGISGTNTLIINTLPTNGVLYYNNTAVLAGDTINNYNPALLTVDPNNGAVTVSFTYSEVDASLQSSAPATVTMVFGTISLSGNVYDDANGLQDAIVNGIGTNAGGNLYAHLLDDNNIVIATTNVSNNGSYSFTGLNGGTYSVLINTSSTASTSTQLPNGWVNTGEYNGITAGNDGLINGVSAMITLSSSNVSNINFGIEQTPTANIVMAPSQVNPGGTVKVIVPVLNGSDPEQGNFIGTDNLDTVIIKTLPNNAVLYYNNVALVSGDTIKNYNPTLLMIDPNDGAITINFTYAEVDAALQSSLSANVSMSFGTLKISGNVFNDANGLTDGIVNGSGTNANGALRAQLVNSSNAIIATAIVASDGTYSFSNVNGGTYTVIVSASSVTPLNLLATPPTDWVITGEHIGTGPGNDGAANGKSLPIIVSTTDIDNINFGLEQISVADEKWANPQLNPGGTIKVPVPVLTGNDPEDGSYIGVDLSDTIIIKTLPFNGKLYYNDLLVNAGDTIKNYDPAKLMLDPNPGIITVSFTYSQVDAARFGGRAASVYLPFSAVLPVTLIDFAGKFTGSSVDLTWSSATETNTSYYELERSADGTTFTSIGKMYASGANSSYFLSDVMPSTGVNYYRLKMFDKDGEFTFSKVVVIKIDGNVVAITSVKPNPFVSNVDVYVDLTNATDIKVGIFDMGGKTIYQNITKGNKGLNWLNVKDLDKLQKGVYILRVTAGETTIQKKILKN